MPLINHEIPVPQSAEDPGRAEGGAPGWGLVPPDHRLPPGHRERLRTGQADQPRECPAPASPPASPDGAAATALAALSTLEPRPQPGVTRGQGAGTGEISGGQVLRIAGDRQDRLCRESGHPFPLDDRARAESVLLAVVALAGTVLGFYFGQAPRRGTKT